MQVLTRQELIWIYAELSWSVNGYNRTMSEHDPESAEYRLAELRRDGLKTVLNKLQMAHDNHSKRIAIK